VNCKRLKDSGETAEAIRSRPCEFNVINLRIWASDLSLPCARRDALSKYASGIFVAQAGSGSDRERWARERSERL